MVTSNEWQMVHGKSLLSSKFKQCGISYRRGLFLVLFRVKCYLTKFMPVFVSEKFLMEMHKNIMHISLIIAYTFVIVMTFIVLKLDLIFACLLCCHSMDAIQMCKGDIDTD